MAKVAPFAPASRCATLKVTMAKNRSRSPSERVRQKRQASTAPSAPPSAAAGAPAAAVEPLRVAPLARPPVFTEPPPRLLVVPEPPPSNPSSGGSGLEPSIAPVSACAELDAMPDGLPSAAGWKRVVALVAALAACAGVAVGVKIMRPKGAQASAAQPAVAAQVAEPMPSPAPPPPPVEQVAEPVATAPSVTATAAATAATATGERSATAAASPPPSEAAVSAAALRDEALKLLEKAKNPEAMAKASAALEADATDAMPYLVLGSALQDAGRWREAHRAYELCAKSAKHGMVDECRAMLRAR